MNAPQIVAGQCWSCGAAIESNDDAGVCVNCGGRNRRMSDIDPDKLAFWRHEIWLYVALFVGGVLFGYVLSVLQGAA